MKADKEHIDVSKKKRSAESTEETLKKLIDDAKTKNEAYKKILKSLNINKNK
jgi:phenylacetate-coenzyme A ligase PaaK-like adenylate-forming protein